MKYYPQNKLTQNLLRSIPKKILNWMTVLNLDNSTTGELETVEWKFDVTTETNTISEKTLGVVITWLGPIHISDESEIYSNVADLQDVVLDLQFIVQVEQAFFKPFEELQDELLDELADKHFDFDAPRPLNNE